MVNILVVYSYSISANEYEIWGVWNLGPTEYADKLAHLSIGTFLKTNEYLYFEPDYYKTGPQISYDGGYYRIKEIISKNGNVVSFYVEHQQTIMTERRKLVTDIVKGKVVMNFIDNDHMWLELDYNDKKYPTDDQFEETDFKGSATVFWRARMINDK
jgi:hypothetical protein